MIKTIGIILLVAILSIIFIEPVRNYLNKLVYREKSELNERQVIGTVSDYNPRVKETQEILKDAGFEPGPSDGMMGTQTRNAIKAFQKAKSLKPTGKIDSTTLLALNREKEAPKNFKQDDTEEILQLHLQEIPKDTRSKEELQKIMEPQNKEIKEEIPKDKTRQIQFALKKAGFYKGAIDGKIGPQTRRAIREFQKSKGLKPDGIIGQKTWEELCKFLKN
jgi:peptidoglycan hydrolase-like protein with peptidoglycan-binding domain